MNYFYFFFFVFLGILVWIRPFAEFLKNRILSSNNINVIAGITLLIGLICVYVALTDEYWFESMEDCYFFFRNNIIQIKLLF